ncbi:MAG: BadF/BadG/BcrA/BcrD ATPase family protein [Clostridia bacterium]
MGVYIGVDGGGTKTMFCLKNKASRFTYRINLSSNPNDVGFENSANLILDGCIKICADNKISVFDIDGIFCGIAGATIDGYKEILTNKISKIFINAKIAASHDGENIIYATFPDENGVIVICGTGSSCFVKKNEVLYRIGGYAAFDLLGNGYEIGKAAIAHSLRCIDGRDKKGILHTLITQKNGSDSLSILNELLALKKPQIASYTPLVFEASEKGDLCAKQILNVNLKFIAEYINTAARFFDGAFGACIAGSVGTNPASIAIIKSYISCRADIFTISAEPVDGAVVKAKLIAEG